MKIIYLIILIALLVLFLLVKKTEKKQNIIFWIIVGSIILIPYNVLVSYILTKIGLKCTLLNYSIVNIIALAIIAIKIFKDKSIQKYYLQKRDIIVMVLMLVLTILIAYKQYGFPFNIKYETTDPGVHYNAAKTFYEQKVLLCDAEKTSYYGFETFMPAAYVNTGILFEMFSNILDKIDMYMVYILFDLIILYLMSVMFYFSISNNKKGKTKNIIAIILSIIFMLGYPLNSMLFGFAYLSVGLLMITGLLAMAKYIKDKEMNIVILSIILFLLMYGVFFSYYLFVPVVYSALGLYILFDIIKNRKEVKIFSKKNIFKVVIILILPTILGFVYFVLPGLLSEGTTELSSMSNEGYIYRDLFSNFVLFAPFMIYYIIYVLKNKKNSFSTILSIILIAFIGVTFIGGMLGKVSSYYYFKSYYVLWILEIYLSYRALEIMIDNKDTKIFALTYILVYVLITLILYFGIDQKITNRNILFNPAQKSSYLLDIQNLNTAFVNRDTTIIKRRQIDAIKYIDSNIDESERDNVIVYANGMQRLWIYELTGITDTQKQSQLYNCPINSIEEYINSDKKYLLYMVNNDLELELSNQANEYDIIFYNEYSAILAKK